MTACKRTRNCYPTSENRHKICVLPLGPGNLFNPTFLYRELSWEGHRKKEEEEKMKNTYFQEEGNIWHKDCIAGGTAFPGRSCKILFCELEKCFFAMLPFSQVCRHFCFSLTRSLLFTAQKNVCFHWQGLSQPVVIQPFIFILSSCPLVLTGQNICLFHAKFVHRYSWTFL